MQVHKQHSVKSQPTPGVMTGGGEFRPPARPTVQRRSLENGPRSAVDDFDAASAGDGQDGVEGRVVGEAPQALLVAAQAAVSQHNPV